MRATLLGGQNDISKINGGLTSAIKIDGLQNLMNIHIDDRQKSGNVIGEIVNPGTINFNHLMNLGSKVKTIWNKGTVQMSSHSGHNSPVTINDHQQSGNVIGQIANPGMMTINGL